MEIDELNWSNWMRLAQEGDDASYRKLLEELSIVIAKYLHSRMGPLEFIDDIVQESLLAIHQARHTYDPSRPFRPWLFAIVRYKSIDMLRKRETREKLETIQARDSALGEQQVAHDGESIQEGLQLFHGIKPQYREALVLTRIVGLSIREAAEQCGISHVAMKVRVHRALKALARELK